jgi:hypothetical protein
VHVTKTQLKELEQLVTTSGSVGGAVGHEVWNSVSFDVSTPVLMTGAVSAGGLMALLAAAAAAAPLPESAKAVSAQVDRSISLLLTVLLMAAWMFVNWCVPMYFPTHQIEIVWQSLSRCVAMFLNRFRNSYL